jgi:hypothetical protein
MSKLTAQAVQDVFMDCLFRDGEPTTDHVRADGIRSSVDFHPERLVKHTSDIVEFLSELPVEFKDGTSFLQACVNRQSEQWGEQTHMDMLFQLGIGIGKVTCPFPREMWKVLPGGMPYYTVKL